MPCQQIQWTLPFAVSGKESCFSECNSAVCVAGCDNALPDQMSWSCNVLLAMAIVLQDYVNAKRAEHAALDKDYRAFTDAKKAVETAKERTKEVKETVKNARAAVREALKTVSDPPAVVSRHLLTASVTLSLRHPAPCPSFGALEKACWCMACWDLCAPGGRGV